VTLFELQRRSYERAGPAVLGSWPPEQAMSDEQLERYLDRRRFCVLATTTPSGAPQARPVAFVRLDGTLWFATVAGARLRNVRADPRVSVVVAEGDREEHAMILVEGTVEVHEDETARERVAAAWREQQGGTPDWAAAFLELRPTRVYSYVAADARV
jgi:PPOX class probable F420-dependent enzyme